MIRTLWVLFAGFLLTAYCAGRVVLRTWLRGEGVSCLCDRMARLWARGMLRVSGAHVRLIGVERVDWTRPVVVVANHQSWFDVFALGAHLPGRARFVGKEELGRIPVFGTAWKACGHVSVNRGDRAAAVDSLNRAGQRVRDDALAVIVFPEGTRSPDGRLQPFKKGAFVLAIQTGVPIVPVGISGSRAVMAKGSFRIRPGEIRVRVGDPIATEGLEHPDRERLLQRARTEVFALMEDPGRREDQDPGIGADQGTQRRA
jgi:1-acyl-sn-glycerol-3-phosphate acyltransferase